MRSSQSVYKIRQLAGCAHEKDARGPGAAVDAPY